MDKLDENVIKLLETVNINIIVLRENFAELRKDNAELRKDNAEFRKEIAEFRNENTNLHNKMDKLTMVAIINELKNKKLSDDDNIIFDKINPKKKSSDSYRRYENYKSALTVGDAYNLGACYKDIRHDLDNGFAKVVENSEKDSIVGKKPFKDIVSKKSLQIINILTSKTNILDKNIICNFKEWCADIKISKEYINIIYNENGSKIHSNIINKYYYNCEDGFIPIKAYNNQKKTIFVYDKSSDSENNVWRELTDKDVWYIINYITQVVLIYIEDQKKQNISNETESYYNDCKDKIWGAPTKNDDKIVNQIKTNIYNKIKSDLN